MDETLSQALDAMPFQIWDNTLSVPQANIRGTFRLAALQQLLISCHEDPQICLMLLGMRLGIESAVNLR